MILIPEERYNNMCRLLKTHTNAENTNSFKESSTNDIIKEIEMEKEKKVDDNLTLENIIQHFPQRMRSRARLIGSYLNKDNQTMWNDKGELLFSNEPIIGTSITDLLYDACCPKRKYEPKGMKIFYQILNSANLPNGMIRNIDRRKWLSDDNSFLFKGWQKY